MLRQQLGRTCASTYVFGRGPSSVVHPTFVSAVVVAPTLSACLSSTLGSNFLTMKFTKSALALLFVTSQASAWTSRQLVHRRAALALNSAVAGYSTDVKGEEGTESFRLAFSEDSKSISPWHDIPLKNEDGSYNMVGTLWIICSRRCQWTEQQQESSLSSDRHNAITTQRTVGCGRFNLMILKACSY